MPQSLEKYRVRLVVEGVDAEADPDAPESFSQELSMRGHIRDAKTAWLDNRKTDVAVSLEVEGMGSERTAKGMAEELSEISVAVLRQAVGTRVTIAGVERISPPQQGG